MASRRFSATASMASASARSASVYAGAKSPVRTSCTVQSLFIAAPLDFDLAVVGLVVDGLGDFLRLLAVAADDLELALALLAVPDDVLVAQRHGDAHPAEVFGDFIGQAVARIQCFSQA